MTQKVQLGIKCGIFIYLAQAHCVLYSFIKKEKKSMRGLEWKSWLFLYLAIFLQELSKSYIINQAPSPPPGGVTFTRRLLTESRCRRALHPHGRTGQERFHLPCGREPLAKALTLSRSSNSRLWGISRRKCRLLTLKKKNHGASQAIQWLSFRFSMQGVAASVLAMGD